MWIYIIVTLSCHWQHWAYSWTATRWIAIFLLLIFFVRHCSPELKLRHLFHFAAHQFPSDHTSALSSPSSVRVPLPEAPHHLETMLAHVAFPPAISSCPVKMTRHAILILEPCVLSSFFGLLSFASLDGFQEVFLEMSSRTGLSWVLPVGGDFFSCPSFVVWGFFPSSVSTIFLYLI